MADTVRLYNSGLGNSVPHSETQVTTSFADEDADAQGQSQGQAEERRRGLILRWLERTQAWSMDAQTEFASSYSFLISNQK